MDKARKITDRTLASMEKKVDSIYNQAYGEISKKWDKYMESHAPKVEEAHQNLLDALISGDQDMIKDAREQYERTVKNVTVNDERFRGMVNETAAKITHTNEVALNYVNGKMANIYTVNYNAFGDEDIKGYSFSLVNEQAVKNLATTGKLALPKKKIDVPKDIAWNKKLINSQMLQGILQGESIPDIAKRLQNVTDMDRVSAIRNARTMTTSAENKGRQDSYKKATDDGVILKRIWVATKDERTRAWHEELDGVEVDVDEPWVNEYGEIMEPGDPNADPANVYNCRCAMRVDVKGFRWNQELEEESQKEIPKVEPVVLHTTNVDDYEHLKDTLKINNVEELSVKELTEKLSEDEIIEKLAGGDMTTGSCASLSLAYAGNKCGFDVTDFRGGYSQKVFSKMGNILDAFKSANAKYEVHMVKKEVSEVTKILTNLPADGKEYILVTGKHASVIRNVEGVGLQYLEMQSAKYSGWQMFAQETSRTYTMFGQTVTETIKRTVSDTLQKRFGCRKTAQYIGVGGQKVAFESKTVLADVSSFQATEEYKDVLGYINTATNKQKKGASGSER